MPWRMRRGCGGLPRAEAGSFATEPGEHEARAVILTRTASTWRGSSGGSGSARHARGRDGPCPACLAPGVQ